MNPRIAKISADIERTRTRIASLQIKQRDLEQLKTALENAEIVAMFRRENITEDEFSALIQARQGSQQVKEQNDQTEENERGDQTDLGEEDTENEI